MGAHARLTPATRTAIAARIDMLIGLLDADDAPFADLEPEEDQCTAGDDGCGFVRLGMHGGWGSAQEADYGPEQPIYGVDQRIGPLNVGEVEKERKARELGLVRTATGWRYPS